MKRKIIIGLLIFFTIFVIALKFPTLHKKGYTQTLTTLMYHHFVNEYDGTNAVSADTFDKQLSEFESLGYNFVSLKDVKRFVKYGLPLPENPVLITMDDGYLSNITIAAPILEKHNASAAVAVIGCSIGKDTYKDTSAPITPHFTLDQAKPFVKKGTLEIISHTFDMHNVTTLDGEDCRVGMLPLENETAQEYKNALEKDFDKLEKTLKSTFKTPLYALAYPYGWYSEELESFLKDRGILITFTTNHGTNELSVKNEDSLRLLNRIAMYEASDVKTIIDSIKGDKK